MSFVTPELCAIGERLRTQDSRGTAAPIFQVRGKRRIYGMDPIYTTDVVWIDTEEGAREVPAPADPENPGDFVIQTGYCEVWEVLMVAFTEEGIKRHLELNGHNYRHYQEVQIYADSLWRCPEMIAIREALMNLPRLPTPCGDVHRSHNGMPSTLKPPIDPKGVKPGATLTPDRLASIIREVDGGHSLGAAALAEAILGHPDMGLPPEEKPAPPPASPHDGDFDDLCCEYSFHSEDAESQGILFQMFREVLARWGTTPMPIPVAAQPLVIVFDRPPGSEVFNFVEVETLDGYSVCAGEWKERSDGRWGLFLHGPTPIPIAERLPEEVDCAPWSDDPDALPWCWVGKEVDGGWEWVQLGILGLRSKDLGRIIAGGGWTHWCASHALPLPSRTT